MAQKIIGVYTIINLINNKIYVGYSKNMNKRLSSHKQVLKRGCHKNDHLQNAVNEYGITNFEFELLEECEEQFLCSQEHYWCMLLDCHNRDKGYNIRPTHPHAKNKRNSPETTKKIVKLLIGRKANENQLRGLEIGRSYRKGKGMSKERLLLNYRKVINYETNTIYNSITEAALDLGYNMTYLSNMLTGAKKKTFNIDYYKPQN